MVSGKKAGRQMKDDRKQRVHMLLDRDLVARIDAASEKRGISRTLYIVAACQTELERKTKRVA